MKPSFPSSLPQPRTVYVDELKAFLGHGDQRVLLLHGRWGTGKTYFWNNFVRTQREYIENKLYSYVSLFGATSLADVRASIVLGGEPQVESNGLAVRWQRTKNWFLRKQRYFDQLRVPYLGGVGALVPKAEELLIRNFLVCFDDLERRNRKLDLEQLFGLVSVLKEQNQCRVVIICNEEELPARDRRALDKYREKIVDRELTFDPQFAQNFRVVFSDDETAIREVFERLRLNNIRVFQQTEWCVRYFGKLLQGCHPVFVQRFHQQCAKLAAVHFAYSKVVSIDDIRSRHWMVEGWRERTSTTDAASEVTQQLQFIQTAADDFIVGYLRNGYCNLAELKPVIDRLNHEHKRSEADMALGRFWETVWDSYHNDTDLVIKDAEALLSKFHPYVPFRNTAGVLKFVKKISPSFDVDPLKELAANSLVRDADEATLRDIVAECKSPAIQKAAKIRETSLKPRKTIEELVVALGESNGWNPGDFSLLNEYSQDELLEWASKANEPNILYILAQTIARGQLESADTYSGNEVGTKFRTVFDRLAERSPLDAERTAYTFERIRRMLKQYGKDASPEICPPRPAQSEEG